ncbi:MAG: polysaccharide deacetylase family protein [Trueperaceae bacterium]|nr:polysaccharide deacetylase family protein [Trueperaceae bacterium]
MTHRIRRSLRRPLRRAWDRAFGATVAIDTAQPVFALTFDDGPHPSTTPMILDVLERHGARATFFMIGEAARSHPEIVARVAATGHAVANHTLHHRSLPGLSGCDRRAAIMGGLEAIGPSAQRLLRPPYGHFDLACWWTARRCGHDVVFWSGHAFDWRDADADQLAANLRAAIRPGAIVLLHDAPQHSDEGSSSPRAALARALDRVLGDLGGALQSVTVPELVDLGRPVRHTRWVSPDAA